MTIQEMNNEKNVTENLNQLNGWQKPVIPQFVADWIEKCKGDKSLRGAMITTIVNGKIDDWLDQAEDGSCSNQETFVKAWILGYEIEKEQRYQISMPKARNHKNHAQILCKEGDKIFWCGEWYQFKTKFTRKELEEAGFGEVFDSPLFEVKEVK